MRTFTGRWINFFSGDLERNSGFRNMLSTVSLFSRCLHSFLVILDKPVTQSLSRSSSLVDLESDPVRTRHEIRLCGKSCTEIVFEISTLGVILFAIFLREPVYSGRKQSTTRHLLGLTGRS